MCTDNKSSGTIFGLHEWHFEKLEDFANTFWIKPTFMNMHFLKRKKYHWHTQKRKLLHMCAWHHSMLCHTLLCKKVVLYVSYESPEFESSLNSIPTKRADYTHHITACSSPGFEKLSTPLLHVLLLVPTRRKITRQVIT